MHPTPTLQIHRFSGSRFGLPDRDLRVWLPQGYDQSEQRYPVFYLHDGQNLFDPETAAFGVAWSAGETAQKLIDARRMQPVIMVGIDNAGAHRIDEYTPVPWEGRGGDGEAFGRMLIDEIKPLIDGLYRTEPGRDSTGIGGSSLGGLNSLWLGLEYPDVFGRVAAMSPSLFWGDGYMSRLIAAQPQDLSSRLWIDSGKNESPELRRDVRDLIALLKTKGWRRHLFGKRATLRTADVRRARHDEASWGRRFDRVLKFLFPPLSKRAQRKRKAKAGAA